MKASTRDGNKKKAYNILACQAKAQVKHHQISLIENRSRAILAIRKYLDYAEDEVFKKVLFLFLLPVLVVQYFLDLVLHCRDTLLNKQPLH
jgi:hypothetical protein